jgi:hypothetical protein
MHERVRWNTQAQPGGSWRLNENSPTGVRWGCFLRPAAAQGAGVHPAGAGGSAAFTLLMSKLP